jgi:hypothetical protein
MRNVVRAAGLAVAAVAVSLALPTVSAHAAGLPCSVDVTIMGITEVVWFDHGTVMESDQGNMECDNGYWQGPNVDSPLPGGGGPVLA